MPIFPGRINQKVEQRSFLVFQFPIDDNTVGGSYQEKSVIRRIPFFENPIINETKKANYIKYAPLGRSSPLYSYFGSDSRMFDIDFFITLPHIIEVFSKDLVALTFPLETRSGGIERADFINKSTASKNINFGSRFIAALNSADVNTQEYKNIVSEADVNTPNSKLNKVVIDVIMYWINLIRAATINNSEKVSYGPPVVRLTHGILYADIPCICLGYKIEKDEEAGDDRNTLLPRRIRVSLQLAEIRHGDFGEYRAAIPVKRDNVVGWECIIKGNGSMTVDPVPIFRSGTDFRRDLTEPGQ